VFDIRFRAWVAAQRHMGFEMDPRELTEDEAAVLRDVTAWWKANRHWLARADILRLDSDDPAVIAEQQLAEDGSRFVAFAGRAAVSDQILPRPLRLTALSAIKVQRVLRRERTSRCALFQLRHWHAHRVQQILRDLLRLTEIARHLRQRGDDARALDAPDGLDRPLDVE
jgi:alpha-galactosidase